MMQATPRQLGVMKAMRQQAMRDQDRERAVLKDAAYRANLEAAFQHQIALSDQEQRQQAETELQRLSEMYGRRVDQIGEAHVEAAMYMQQQSEARAAQELRLAELNERQEQRFHSALSAVKAQQGVAKAQAAAVQLRRAQILRAERDKAQAFTAEQAGRANTHKRRQADLERQEVERRKRGPNGLAMDFRQTRLHEGLGAPAPLAVPAVVAPPLPAVPDPIDSAEELQHRAAMEKRRREAAAMEAEIRARERFLAAQAKRRADAQKQAVEAELAELAAQRLQAKKQALAAHRLRLRDQRKQQELQRVFEDNFLSGAGGMDDDLAPRALPAFLKPVAAASPPPGRPTAVVGVGASPDPPLPRAAAGRAPSPPLLGPAPAPAEIAAAPRWSKCRTAPLGRVPPPPPLPIAWGPGEGPAAVPTLPSKGEVAVQTELELLAAPATQPTGPRQERPPSKPDEKVAVTVSQLAEEDPTRLLAWPDPESAATPPSIATASAAPHPSPSPEVTAMGAGPDGVGPRSAPSGQAMAQSQPPQPAAAVGVQLESLQLGLCDEDDEADAWGEVQVDRELSRMKKELGIEDSDLRSSVSSIDSVFSVPSFLKDAAVVAAARQASSLAAAEIAAARARAGDAAAAAAAAAGPGNPGKLPHGPSASPRPQPQQPPAAAAVVAMLPVDRPGTVPLGGGRPEPARGATEAVTALDALGTILRRTSAEAGRHMTESSSSPADTIDSSILRILDSPSSASTPTAYRGATPPASAHAAGDAKGPGGAAGLSAIHTPGSISLPSDLDEVLLLTELDWEELEGLAGLRGTDVKKGKPTSPATAAAIYTSGLSAAAGVRATPPPRIAGIGTAGARGGVDDGGNGAGGSSGSIKVESPSSTFSGVSSSISDDSLRRLVAQGILPPEIATLLASTPPSGDHTGPLARIAAAPAAAAAVAAPAAAAMATADLPAMAPGGRLAAPPPPLPARTLSTATSPATSSFLEMNSLLARPGVPVTTVPTASGTSLNSLQGDSSFNGLSALTHGGRLGPARSTPTGDGGGGGGKGSAAGGLSKSSSRGLFMIPEGGTISLGELSAAGAAPPGPMGLLPDAETRQLGLLAPAQLPPQQQHGMQVPVRPQGQGPAVTAAGFIQRNQASGLLEPVRLTLADLNRQLLASTGGAASSRRVASSSGSPRPVKPGPLIITSGASSELRPQPVLAPPRAPQPSPRSQSQPHPPSAVMRVPGADTGGTALFMSLSASPASLSLSSMSSLILSPTAQRHQHRALQPHRGSGLAAVGADAAPAGADAVATATGGSAAAAAIDVSDTSSTLSSLHLSRSAPNAAAANRPDASSAATPPSAAVQVAPPAAPAMPASAAVPPSSSPYDLYDKEAVRLAELMATITASLRQSAEAVARSGGGGAAAAASSYVGAVASPSTSSSTANTATFSRNPRGDPQRHPQHHRHGAASRVTAAAEPRPTSSETSVSPPSTCGSSWTLSSMGPLPSPPPRPTASLQLEAQSPVAAMLHSARTAAAATATTAAATAPRTEDKNAPMPSVISGSGGSSGGPAVAMSPLSGSGNNSRPVASAPSVGGSSSSSSSRADPTALVTVAAAAAPSTTRHHDATADGYTNHGLAGPRPSSSASFSSRASIVSGLYMSETAAPAESAMAVAAAMVTTIAGGGGGGPTAHGGSLPARVGQDDPTTPNHLTGAGGIVSTGAASSSSTTPSSVLSGLSSVFAMLRMGVPGAELRPQSDAAAAAPPGAVALPSPAQPGSPPPPPPPPTASPIPSMPSPPPTPCSPILSESSYSSLSLPPVSPGPTFTVPLAALGAGAVVHPRLPGALEQIQADAKPLAPIFQPRASVSVSSSDDVSSVAEAIAGLLAQRIRSIDGSQAPPAPAPPRPQQQQQQQPPPPEQQQQKDQPPQRTLQLQAPPITHADNEVGGVGSSYPTACDASGGGGDAALATASSADGRSGSHGLEVWASLTGQSLAEALAGLSGSGEPYDDLLRSSLALSNSSLTSGGAPDDDSTSVQGTLAPSDLQEMTPGNVTAPEAFIGKELEEGREPLAEVSLSSPPSTSSPVSISPAVALVSCPAQVAAGDTETMHGTPRRTTPAASRLLADVDAALARVTSLTTDDPAGHQPGGQAMSDWGAADSEVPVALSSRSLPRGPLPPSLPPPSTALDTHQQPSVTTYTSTAAWPATESPQLPLLLSQPLPVAAVPPLELCSSSDSDEFASIMAGLMQDIQRGLAALKAAPPSQQPQSATAGLREPAPPAGGLAGAVPGVAGAAAKGEDLAGVAAQLESTTSSVQSVHWEQESDKEEADAGHADSLSLAWWPEVPVGLVAQAPLVAAVRAGERSAAAGQQPAVGVCLDHGESTQQSMSSSLSETSIAAARQLHQMPTLSRGIAEAPVCGGGGGDSDAELQHEEVAGAAAAAAEPTYAAVSRRDSHGSAASSGAASSITLGPLGPPGTENWSARRAAASTAPDASTAAAIATSDGVAYSFLLAPRASMARNRTPPSVQSGADSPGHAPSGSSGSASVSSVSSLDSFSQALVHYPEFGGATQSPMDTPSHASSSDGGGEDCAVGGGVSDGAAIASSEAMAAVVQPLLPMEYQPVAPTPHSSLEQEPWRGAWDPPLPHRPAGAAASAAGSPGAALLVLGLEAASTAAEALLDSRPSDEGFNSSGSIGLDVIFSGASSSSGGDVNGEFYGGGGDEQYPVSGSQGSQSRQANLAGERRHEDTQPRWGRREQQPGAQRLPEEESDPGTPVGVRREREKPHHTESLACVSSSVDVQQQQQQQQVPSPSRWRQALGMQPLILKEIPAIGDGGSRGHAAGVMDAGLGLDLDIAAGAGTAAAAVSANQGAGQADDALLPHTPFESSRLAAVVLQASVPQEAGEQQPLPSNRGRDDAVRRHSAGGTGPGTGGGGSGGGYAGALSEELLSDLLMWTVSDFFSSPGSGSATEGE